MTLAWGARDAGGYALTFGDHPEDLEEDGGHEDRAGGPQVMSWLWRLAVRLNL